MVIYAYAQEIHSLLTRKAKTIGLSALTANTKLIINGERIYLLTTVPMPQRLNLLIGIIRARFGDYVIGRGNSAIRCSSRTLAQG
jgi:hypothetical protein